MEKGEDDEAMTKSFGDFVLFDLTIEGTNLIM